MKAVMCKQFGPPQSLVLEDVPAPVPGKGEVVIDVKAASVNFPDVLIIENKYQFKPPLPFSPGSEVAGVVKSLGEGVSHLTVGQPVVALLGHGAFAEEVAAPADKVVPLPPGVDFATAAAMGLTYATSHHAVIDRAQLKAGETMLVLGAAGGVGVAAIEIGKIVGARVIAAASSADKLAVCKAHGADELINYATEDLRERIKQLTGGKGVDVVYDPVGGAYSEAALRSTAWRGRFLVVGFANGEIPRIPLNLTLLKGCAIVGVFWGDFARREPEANYRLMTELFRWLEQGRIKPHISGRYPLARTADALIAMAERKVTGKVVILVEE
ncbi:MAG: NADPH:quinone oxidoreductase family protein [Burkholderiales bacterium]|nr:NADPH:quinone oxidoreductase family protein [Burkholderiales bacterium]